MSNIVLTEADVQRIADEAVARRLDGGGLDLRLRSGVVSLHWAAGSQSCGPFLFDHGLGRVPLAVVANGFANVAYAVVLAEPVDKYKFRVQAWSAAGPLGGTADSQVSWIAVA